MQPRGLAKSISQGVTPLEKYEPAEWTGKNESGISPIGDRVLILPDKAAELIGSIVIPGTRRDIDGRAAETGVIVAIGEAAWKWNSDRSRPFEGTRPKVGQRVWFERYAGSPQRGKDGESYILMDDKCVGAVATD